MVFGRGDSGKPIDETLAKRRLVKLNFAMLARFILILLLVTSAGAAERGVEFFEQRIRPVLAGECYECHAGEKAKGGLRVDYRDGLLKGGERGPALVAGDARASLLIQAIRHEHAELRMPKNGAKLSEAVLKDFADWINAGAPDPRDQPPAANAVATSNWDATLAVRRQWWSFQPVQKPTVPMPANAVWSSHAIDRFLLAKMEDRGLQPAAPADPRTLVRRLHFALTGLPPKPEEVERFLQDFGRDPKSAVAKRADELLASPHFGERWARHWMDLVRYAESHGSEGDPEIPRAWRYRDYLIRAFNADVPLDQLIREHFAGDLLAQPRWNHEEDFNESALGIAHWRMVEHGFQPVDVLDDQVKAVENQIDVLGKAFQGLTIACARCHDHKFDPVSQRDYYALYGILTSVRPTQVTLDSQESLSRHRAELTALKRQIREALADAWLAAAENWFQPGQVSGNDIRTLTAVIGETQRQIAAIEAAVWGRLGNSASSASLPAPIAWWTFEGDARDLVGSLHGELLGGATLKNGRVHFDGKEAHVRTAPLTRDLREKTLEAWVALDTLDQRGGGVITVETKDGKVFDAIVYAEKQEQQWVPGSNNFRRSRELFGPDEDVKPGQLVHLVLTHSGNGIVRLYRNGERYGIAFQHDEKDVAVVSFLAGESRVLLGRRHTGGGRAFLAGALEEARIYDRALSPEEVTSSFRAGPLNVGSDAFGKTITAAELEQLAALRRQLVEKQRDLAQARMSPWAEVLRAASGDVNHPLHAWARLNGLSDDAVTKEWTQLRDRWRAEQAANETFNRTHFRSAWTLSDLDDYAKWFRSGPGLPGQPSSPGDFQIEPDSDRIVNGIYPAGVFTPLLSQKHGGLLASPQFVIESDHLSVRALGGNFAAVRVVLENYPLGINANIFPWALLKKDEMGWVQLRTAYRRGTTAYLEFATLEDLTRQTGGQMATDEVRAKLGGRSWFGVDRVVFHDTNATPREAALFLDADSAPRSVAELAKQHREAITAAIQAWRAGKTTGPQVDWLDFFVRRGLLPVTVTELPTVAGLVARYRKLEADVPVARRAPGWVEMEAQDAPLMVRGEHTHPGASVPRGYLQVLGKADFAVTEKLPSRSGRLQLAEAVASPDNPLTARVMANRVWHHIFGRGIVPTVDNFGRLGETPTHPELLDYLASRFVEDNWSLKQMIRFLVISKAWQLSSEPSARALDVDPGNELLSHFRVRRLEAEAVRDALLAVSGELDPTLFGSSVPINNTPRRSIYLTVKRNSLSPFLEVFDSPKPFTTFGKRDVTNVPAQSLALLNDPFVIRCAERWAKRLVAPRSGSATDARVRQMFEMAFARPPSSSEAEQAQRYLADLAAQHGVDPAKLSESMEVWRDFAQSLFNLKEFIYLR